MARPILIASLIAGTLAFLTMAATTVVWMTVPERIVYRESSSVATTEFSVEVQQHGKSYFVTPQQKRTLDRITRGTPIAWFGGLAVVVISIVVGAAASLRLTL